MSRNWKKIAENECFFVVKCSSCTIVRCGDGRKLVSLQIWFFCPKKAKNGFQRRWKKALRLFRTASFMLRYIVRHLRERALTNAWQYISATIFDGLNNLKEKKTPIFWSRKKPTAEKPSGSILVIMSMRRINSSMTKNRYRRKISFKIFVWSMPSIPTSLK